MPTYQEIYQKYQGNILMEGEFAGNVIVLTPDGVYFEQEKGGDYIRLNMTPEKLRENLEFAEMIKRDIQRQKEAAKLVIVEENRLF